MTTPPAAAAIRTPLAPIALARDSAAVLARALQAARSVCNGDSAFAAVRNAAGSYPMDVRLGVSDPGWDHVSIKPGRGAGGQVIDDLRPRTSDNYLQDPTITPDYVPIMRREQLRGLVVAAVEDLSTPAGAPAALIYVSTTAPGAPGDRAVAEILHVAEMAAVGLAHVGPQPSATDADVGLSAREIEVLRLLGEGASNRAIAEQLVIAEPTVKGHLRAILRKLEAPSRLAAVAAARRRGLV